MDIIISCIFLVSGWFIYKIYIMTNSTLFWFLFWMILFIISTGFSIRSYIKVDVDAELLAIWMIANTAWFMLLIAVFIHEILPHFNSWLDKL